ncbi:hypothetical protein [Rubrivirga sp. IMCC43871]|uniref:hypothetical protein n=1 Tax=Rubrivirga sp. IMCC43871 TaxID=3391575 RepID=UPI00398FFCFE
MTLRILPLLLALACAAPAVAQTVVLSKTDSGVRMSSATATPHGGEPAAVVVLGDSGAWSLRPLSAGDVPTHVVSQMATANQRWREHRRDAMQRQPRPDTVSPLWDPGENVDLRDTRSLSMARYTIHATVPTDRLDAVLVRLADDGALVGLEATSQGERARVEATFGFDSVSAWADWKAAPATAALLAPLADAQTTLHAQ